ncbi:hypothetical protein XHV734_0833 [Xanthomonas hortorum pv. vitians]|nr:hypothetical protein XHV734_0833 [Xanthomonas hortorum pv. vitians]
MPSPQAELDDVGSDRTRDRTEPAVDRAVAARPGCRWQRLRPDGAGTGAPALAGAALRVPARANPPDHHQQRRAHARLVRHRRHGFRTSCRQGRHCRIGGPDRGIDRP